MHLDKLSFDQSALEAICRQWRVVKLEAFGSVLREDFGPDSDVDLLVTFAPGHKPTFADLIRLQEALEELFARKVDLAEPEQLKWVIRDRVQQEAQVVYAA
jgi:uncharacterized protein